MFFFYESADHRDLHSFPTRRSSDLRRPPSGAQDRQRTASSCPRQQANSRPVAASQRRELACCRSEEHTSELQSRQYLVCRLLLEKKKISTKPAKQAMCTSRSKSRPS